MRPPPKPVSEYADTTALTRLRELADSDDGPALPDAPSGEFVSPEAFLKLKAAFSDQRKRLRQTERLVAQILKHLGLGYAPE